MLQRIVKRDRNSLLAYSARVMATSSEFGVLEESISSFAEELQMFTKTTLKENIALTINKAVLL